MLLLATEGASDVYQIARGTARGSTTSTTASRGRSCRSPTSSRSRAASTSSARSASRSTRAAVAAAAERVRDEGFRAVAVALSLQLPQPRPRARGEEILREELDGVDVSLSHRVAREWREYERTSSAVFDAYIAPVDPPLPRAARGRDGATGLTVPLHVMQSNGGVLTADVARASARSRRCSRARSGGTMGGVALPERSDRPNLICVDMGGTSFDVSLVVDGEPDVVAGDRRSRASRC